MDMLFQLLGVKVVEVLKSKYTDINGKEIKVNDGNTFIQIIPVTTQIELS